LSPPLALVREQRFVTAQTGGASLYQNTFIAINLIPEIRKKALFARREMSFKERRFASHMICKKLIASNDFLSASLIACYLPMSDEVDTRFIIEQGWRANKRIFVPITHNDGEMLFREIRPDTTIRRKKIAIWEPAFGDFISPQELQLVVTPTVAFDSSNNRIGMGGGYYDRCFSFLKHHRNSLDPKLLGVAFQCQQVEKISPNTWDIRLYKVFSC